MIGIETIYKKKVSLIYRVFLIKFKLKYILFDKCYFGWINVSSVFLLITLT